MEACGIKGMTSRQFFIREYFHHLDDSTNKSLVGRKEIDSIFNYDGVGWLDAIIRREIHREKERKQAKILTASSLVAIGLQKEVTIANVTWGGASSIK